jgi:diguanylate cyclase (GGDEF)-like protein
MKKASSILRDIKLIRQAEKALEKTQDFLNKIKNNKLSLTLEDGVYKIDSNDMNRVAALITDLEKSGNNLSAAMDLLKELMIYDEITHMYSRRYILNILEKETIRAKRYKSNFAIVALEVEHKVKSGGELAFESENELINFTANEIRKYTRNSDSAGRTGPFTFLLVLPETDTEGAKILADRICEDLSTECTIGSNKLDIKVYNAIVDNKDAESQNLMELMYMLDNQLANIRK